MKILSLCSSLLLTFGISVSNSQDYYQVNAVEFAEKISNNKVTLLDVRTSGEFMNGHISDAGQLNFYSFDFRKKLLLLPRDQPVYLYCNTGFRSRIAAEILVKNGYKEVYNLEHGIMDWNLQDLPVVIEPDAQPDNRDKMEPDEYYALIQSDEPVFIDFYAPWCGPCRQMMPMIDSLKVTYKEDIKVVKINADASKRLVKELGILGVPYFKMFNKGELLYSHTGLLPKPKVVEWFSSVL